MIVWNTGRSLTPQDANKLAATERLEIADQVKANGAVYEGDLTKQITHLISFRTDGAKYRAAKSWGLRIVSVEWLRDSLERGMILDETLYDPVLPPEERGKGAWDRTKPRRTSLGKRSRDDSTGTLDGRKRKLRRTASTKLTSQNDQIWGDIVGGGGTVLEVARSGQWGAADEAPKILNDKPPIKELEDPPERTLPNTVEPQPVPKGFFSGCRFYFHGFIKPKTQILCNHLLPQDAEISTTVDELLAPSNSPIRLFRVVPSSLPVSEHPELPASHVQVGTVTEWWVERCLHYKRFMDPGDHVIGRPFPVFPIPEFKDITISSAAFSGIDLLHVTRAVEVLGAKYSEDFTKHSSMLLTKTTVGLRKDKMEGAREWKVPIVDASWLWDSIEAGVRLPLHKYRFRGQKRAGSVLGMSEQQSTENPGGEKSKSDLGHRAPKLERHSSNSTARPPRNARLDNTVFISDEPAAPVKEDVDSQAKEPVAQASNSTSDLSCKSEPLSEINPNSPSRTVSTAPAPSDHPNPRPPKEDISNAISNLLARTKSTTPALHSDAPEGRKRGRILGRAASNVSAASTPFSRATSVDSTATHGHPVEYPAPSSKNETAARKSANEKIEEFIKANKGDREAEEEEERPSTQLQYEDPESAAYKERVMARMLGKKVDERRVKVKERVATIADGVGTGERPLRRRGRPPTGGLR
jgi:DNA replication regulator DPB11